jgi:RNA polymerase sigma-70 factor (ECF subfamily)
MNDKQAIRRLKNGDLGGLKHLVNQYQTKSVRAAYLIINDRSLAEEVVQNAILKVADRIGQFDQKLPFGPWFYRIIVNDALKVLRKQKRLVSLDQQLDLETASLMEILIDPGLSPEEIVSLEQNRHHLIRAIQE